MDDTALPFLLRPRTHLDSLTISFEDQDLDYRFCDSAAQWIVTNEVTVHTLVVIGDAYPVNFGLYPYLRTAGLKVLVFQDMFMPHPNDWPELDFLDEEDPEYDAKLLAWLKEQNSQVILAPSVRYVQCSTSTLTMQGMDHVEVRLHQQYQFSRVP